MEAVRRSDALTTDLRVTPPARAYGVPTWLFFFVVTVANLGFAVTQIIINNVRSGALPIPVLEDMFFSGVYLLIATAGVAFLLISGLLLGVTVAVIVVRAWMQYAPCRFYGVLFLLQLLPWAYFLTELAV